MQYGDRGKKKKKNKNKNKKKFFEGEIDGGNDCKAEGLIMKALPQHANPRMYCFNVYG